MVSYAFTTGINEIWNTQEASLLGTTLDIFQSNTFDVYSRFQCSETLGHPPFQNQLCPCRDYYPAI